MVVYLLLALFFYRKYKEGLDIIIVSKNNTVNEGPNNKLKEINDKGNERSSEEKISVRFLKLLLFSTIYFVIAAVISLIEFLLKRQSLIGNLILVLIGIILVIFIYKFEKDESKDMVKFDVKKDELRSEMLSLPRNSLKQFISENDIRDQINDFKLDLKEDDVKLFNNEEDEIPK